jgi:hypothetical protein
MPLFPRLSAAGGEMEFALCANSDAIIRHEGRIMARYKTVIPWYKDVIPWYKDLTPQRKGAIPIHGEERIRRRLPESRREFPGFLGLREF